MQSGADVSPIKPSEPDASISVETRHLPVKFVRINGFAFPLSVLHNLLILADHSGSRPVHGSFDPNISTAIKVLCRLGYLVPMAHGVEELYEVVQPLRWKLLYDIVYSLRDQPDGTTYPVPQ